MIDIGGAIIIAFVGGFVLGMAVMWLLLEMRKK